METFFGPQIKIAISKKSDGPMNFVGEELFFDGERRMNRAEFLKRSMGISATQTVTPFLKHGNDVEVVYYHNAVLENLPCDAVITGKKKLCLTMTLADCPPVVFFDPINEVIAVAHCGWKPLSKNIIENTVEKMKAQFNCNPKSLRVFIGPGICVNEFEIGPEVAQKFGWFPKGKVFFNLQVEIEKQLDFAGIVKDNILTSKECTHCSYGEFGPKYFSHRRDHLDPLQAQMCCIMMV